MADLFLALPYVPRPVVFAIVLSAVLHPFLLQCQTLLLQLRQFPRRAQALVYCQLALIEATSFTHLLALILQ